MKELLLVLDDGSQHTRRIREAVNLINGCQRYYYLRLTDDPIDLAGARTVVNGDETASKIAQTFPDQNIIYITDRRFDDNWFSHEYRHCAIITTSDWEQRFAPPSLRAYLAYQIAQALIVIEADLTEDMLLQMVHRTPIGCFHDLNDNKDDIKFGMVSGNMCFDCEGKLRQFGTDPSAINATRQILERVRDESIGRPSMVDPNSAFIVMRFSENDDNANAYKYGLVPGLNDVGLTARRGDDKVQSAQILEQVLRYIERSRFVIAKVDVENLNVYFELGLAMGLDKDVLLVSESSLVVTLPTDLNNWECLTYDKGDFEQLRDRVSQYFTANYHLSRNVTKP